MKFELQPLGINATQLMMSIQKCSGDAGDGLCTRNAPRCY